MEMKSISGFTCYIKDIEKTAAFYEALGFRFGNREPETITIYLNWFSVKFLAAPKEANKEFMKEATGEPKGTGIYINIKVDDADAFYEGVVAKGLKPSSQPRDWPWGNREFVLRDPDGYKLVFFEKK